MSLGLQKGGGKGEYDKEIQPFGRGQACYSFMKVTFLFFKR